jgi:anti-anti-sigma factor
MESRQIRSNSTASSSGGSRGANCIVRVEVHHGQSVVWLRGELDLVSRLIVHSACVNSVVTAVIVDLSGLEFMDCGGYRALSTAREALESQGGSLTWRHQSGQPERLLDLLAELDLQDDQHHERARGPRVLDTPAS